MLDKLVLVQSRNQPLHTGVISCVDLLPVIEVTFSAQGFAWWLLSYYLFPTLDFSAKVNILILAPTVFLWIGRMNFVCVTSSS